MPELPSGEVTFLLTDVEGSTRLWGEYPELAGRALARHDEIMAAVVSAHGGVIPHRGEGDSVLAAFAGAGEAVAAALALQLALSAERWPGGIPLRVRMGLHTGEAAIRDGDYEGLEVNRAARLRGMAHGGQTLLSRHTAELVAERLPPEASLRNLGTHRLKDLEGAEQVWQLCHPRLEVDFAPLISLDAVRDNLPVQLTNFVGREHEVKELVRLLPENHLLTLTGAGGCGKTRLALEVAAQVLDAYPDGVWLAELASVADPDLVPQAVSDALHVKEEPGRPLIETMTHHVATQQTLLLLDNCEHVVEAAAGLAQRLLRSAPGLRILATSQEPLKLPGELTWRVPSLTSPDVDRLPELEALAGYEAVVLFVDRARASRSQFALTAQNAAAVAQICHRLDGVPLAIELAAARVKVMGPEEILRRLEDRFRLLTGGGRMTLPRHQTLRGAVDWSHDLLGPAEQVFFRRLSVFVGGFDLASAEAVCLWDGAADGFEHLAQLVDRSLVIADFTDDGDTRYRLLETFRHYGRQRLEKAGETKTVADRHFDHFLALAEAAHAGRVRDEEFWGQRLETEHDNLRAALAWAAATDPERHLRLAGALGWFWASRSHLTEGRQHLVEALRRAGGKGPLAARATMWTGNISALLGDGEASLGYLEAGIALWRAVGDKAELADALETLGWSRFFNGDDPAALEAMEESLALQTEMGDPKLIHRARVGVCQALVALGDVTIAEPMAEELLAVSLEWDDVRSIHFAYHFLGDCALIRGDCALSEERYARSLAAALRLGDRLEASFEIQGMAMCAAGLSRPVRALRLDAAVTAFWKTLGVAQLSVPFWDALLDKWLGRARAELSLDAADAASAEGRQMSFEEAVTYALREAPDL